jgi:hypothetical protein
MLDHTDHQVDGWVVDDEPPYLLPYRILVPGVGGDYGVLPLYPTSANTLAAGSGVIPVSTAFSCVGPSDTANAVSGWLTAPNGTVHLYNGVVQLAPSVNGNYALGFSDVQPGTYDLHMSQVNNPPEYVLANLVVAVVSDNPGGT